VIQKGRKLGEAVPLVVLSHEAKEKDVRQALEEIDKLPVVMGKTMVIRVEGKEEG
jgi:homoserine dehydrogenase